MIFLSACGSAPKADVTRDKAEGLFLRDSVVYSQKDPRWASDLLGETRDTMGSDGCLVTSAAMALTNLGFQTNPKDLNKRLTTTKSYTKNGWLIWDGIRRVTDGRAVATYYDKVDAPTIDACLRRGAYPMVQFYLPNGRSHWAMIVRHDDFYGVTAARHCFCPFNDWSANYNSQMASPSCLGDGNGIRRICATRISTFTLQHFYRIPEYREPVFLCEFYCFYWYLAHPGAYIFSADTMEKPEDARAT